MNENRISIKQTSWMYLESACSWILGLEPLNYFCGRREGLSTGTLANFWSFISSQHLKTVYERMCGSFHGRFSMLGPLQEYIECERMFSDELTSSLFRFFASSKGIGFCRPFKTLTFWNGVSEKLIEMIRARLKGAAAIRCRTGVRQFSMSE